MLINNLTGIPPGNKKGQTRLNPSSAAVRGSTLTRQCTTRDQFCIGVTTQPERGKVAFPLDSILLDFCLLLSLVFAVLLVVSDYGVQQV